MIKSRTIVTIIAALFFAISTVQAINSDPVTLKRRIGYAFLGAAFIMVIVLLAMLIKRRIRDWSHDCFWDIHKFNDLNHAYIVIHATIANAHMHTNAFTALRSALRCWKYVKAL